MFHGPLVATSSRSSRLSAWSFAAVVQTMAYFTPIFCSMGTPTAALLSV